MEGVTMTDRRGSLFWGLVLILGGVVLLLVTTDLLPEMTGQAWAIIWSIAAVVLLAGYLLTGWRHWYYLFPGAVSAAITALLWLVEADVAGSAAAGLFLAIISVPFWIAYLIDSQTNRWALIPGGVVAAIGVVLLFEGEVSDNVFVALILLAIAMPFVVIFLLDRRQWWALIPGYVMAVLGLIFLIVGEDGAYLPVMIMFGIALPFLVVFLRDRRQWWALIPASVMGVIGLFLLIVIGGSEASWAPALIVFAIALPFYVIYFLRRDQWWALLPAAVLTGAGLATVIATGDVSESNAARFGGAVVLASLALVFGFLWWQRKVYQTGWAGVPALILATGALAVLIFGLGQEIFWALALIALGGWILFRNLRPRAKSGQG
jgi:hypothetical protein